MVVVGGVGVIVIVGAEAPDANEKSKLVPPPVKEVALITAALICASDNTGHL